MDSGHVWPGKDPDPWQFLNFNCAGNVNLPALPKHIALQFGNFNSVSNVDRPALPKQSTNLRMFPSCSEFYGFSQLNPGLIPPSNPTGFTSDQKTLVVYDQSCDRKSLFLCSPSTQFSYKNPSPKEAIVSTGNGNEDMHEDTEEIDALLYSDSDSDNEYEEEDEASTGHSPIEATTEEEVASSGVLLPLLPCSPRAKRRRVDLDPYLADTASSSYYCDDSEERKKVKKERIQETVRTLRRIVPEGKGKDAMAVIDEAIRYLKTLRLTAKGLGVDVLN